MVIETRTWSDSLVKPSNLSQLGKDRYWRQRARAARRALRSSLTRSRFADARSGASLRFLIARDLLRQSALVALTALALYAALQVVEEALELVPWSSLAFWGESVKGDGYRDLVAAGVGAAATFLGLYYATVGVVASTVYQAAPAAVRALFVQEPSGVVYIRGVVRAIIFGIACLLAGSVGFAPAPLTLLVFGVYSALAVLRLMVLGSRIFNFFDPSSLGVSVGNKFSGSLGRIVNLKSRASEAAQLSAHSSAEAALNTYRQLADLMHSRQSKDATGASRLSAQLLQIARTYASAKSRIAVDSRWWSQRPIHPNWMTLGHSRLQMALATFTGAPPTLGPDRRWVENSLAGSLEITFGAELSSAGSPAIMSHSGDIAALARYLGGLFQVDEALLFEGAWRKTLFELIEAEPGSLAEVDRIGSLNRLAVAEQLIHPLIQLWLGHVDASVWISKSRLYAELDLLVQEGFSRASRLPVNALELASKFRSQLEMEESAEGFRVTPVWWTRHYLARAVAEQYSSNTKAIRSAAEDYVVVTVERFISANEWESATVFALAALELYHKIEIHQGAVDSAFERLKSLENANSGNPSWPESTNHSEWAQSQSIKLFELLAECLGSLSNAGHDEDTPDLRGQVFQILTDATFDLLIAGSPAALPIFTSLLVEADVMRGRAVHDLAGREPSVIGRYAAEPWLALMELSGCALVIERADRQGVWTQIRELWGALVSSPKFGTDRLVAALAISADVMLGTPGGLIRMSRAHRLEEALGERGFKHWAYNPFSLVDESAGGDSLVQAFAPGDMKIGDELSDAFAAEFLVPLLADPGALPRRTSEFIESISRRNQPRNSAKPDERSQPGAGAADAK